MLAVFAPPTGRRPGSPSAAAATRTRPAVVAPRILALLLQLLAARVVSASLPYVPTTVLLSASSLLPNEKPASVAFILAPRGSSVDLLSLDISTTLRASSLGLQTLTAGLPFFNTGSRTAAFTPTLLANGSIAVYSGDCSAAGATPVAWTYSPRTRALINSTAGLAGSWVRHDVAAYSSAGVDITPSLLGGALGFSSQLAPVVSPSTVYVYGGMCPLPNQTASTGQTAATYSNQMLRLSLAAGSGYTVGPVLSRGPPIAEAGFTFTPLAPLTSNRSGIVSQQVNNVLLGGHTQAAFINMSTAAVWSLPEESWTFLPIAAPAVPNTELAAVKKAVGGRALPTSVSSRSGHTAVLSEDGSAVVVLGGWVGDVTQPADPQLAVLEMGGAAYGGWKWSIPAAQPAGPGIYGHGAALLPGNVMMVYGGYNISPTSKLKMRPRQGADGGSTTALFLNLTTLAWSDTYTNPGYTSGPSSNASSPPSDTSSVGLGVGIGAGVLLVIILAGLIFCLRHRYKTRQHRRDEAVRDLAQDHGHFLNNAAADGDMRERAGAAFPLAWGPRAAHDWYTGGHDPYSPAAGRSLGFESLRGSRDGAYPPAPLPRVSGVMRNPVRQPARGSYQQASVADYEARTGQRAAGDIHPIYEAADEDGDAAGDAGQDSRPISSDKDDDVSATASDPFLTPTGPSPEATEDRLSSPPQDREVQGWVSDVDAADAVLAARAAGAGGASRSRHVNRTSPTRRQSTRSKGSSPTSASFNMDDEARTASNLSDRSAFSFVAGSYAGSVRSRLGLGSAATHTKGEAAAAAARLGSSGGTSEVSGHSYNTARSSFPALQAEGPTLLLGNAGGNNRASAPAGAGGDHEEDEAPGSPSKSKPRRASWLGSFRRVFAAGTNSPGSSRGESPESHLEETEDELPEPRLFGLKDVPHASLLRRKQGRSAWDAQQQPQQPQRLRVPREEVETASRKSDDWDVEQAGEGRMMQVMFTVPRDKLRVVNAEVEREEVEAEIVNPEHDEGQAAGEGRSDLAQASTKLDPDEAREREGKGKGKEVISSGFPEVLKKRRAQTPPWPTIVQEPGPADLESWDRVGGLAYDSSGDDDDDDEKRPLQGGGRGSGLGVAGLTTSTTVSGSTAPATPSTPERPRRSLRRKPALSSPASVFDDDGTEAVMTAEAVRLNRPPTRVLEMVEQIESSSRKSSPSLASVRRSHS